MKIPVICILFVISCYSALLSAADNHVLVYRHETMPWCGTVEGQDAGITVEILEQITLHGGPSFTYQSLPWRRAQKMVHNTKGAAIIPLTRTPTREEHYTWIVPLVPNQIRLTYFNESPDNASLLQTISLERANELSVGVIQGSSIIPTLEGLGFASIYEANGIEQLIGLLMKGRYDAMVESQLVDTYQWKKLGHKKSDLVAGPNIEGVSYIYLGAGKDFPPEIAAQIREAMEKIKANGIYDEILSRWY